MSGEEEEEEGTIGDGPLADRAPWPVRESRVEYDTGWYDGGYDLVEQPNGTTKRYYWAALDPAVVVVPLLDDEVVFVEQYRPAIRAHSLELPAGIVEPLATAEEHPSTRGEDVDGAETVDGADGAGGTDGTGGVDDALFEAVTESGREPYAAAGARELREETGYEAGSVTTLESFWCATGVLRHRRGVVVAEDLTHVGQELDDNEFLSVTTRPREEALAAARQVPVNDASLEALLLAETDGYL